MAMRRIDLENLITLGSRVPGSLKDSLRFGKPFEHAFCRGIVRFCSRAYVMPLRCSGRS